MPMQPRGTSVLSDVRLYLSYRRLLRNLRPAALLTFTIKPNIYGSLAARTFGKPVINNVSGLGTLFVRPSPLTRLVTRLYRTALVRSATVFFQNRDDAELFMAEALVRREQVRLLPGSGIDLNRFKPGPLPEREAPTFLLAARLLKDKGVTEFVDAAQIVRVSVPQAKFRIAGLVEPAGPAAVPVEQLEGWAREGAIDWVGPAADIRPFISDADCIVLPSYYREGVPRILLEAAAMGRPTITTDTPGCRDAIEDGVTGFLCAPRSADSLAAAMLKLARLSPNIRQGMGAAARARMERSFSQELVHGAYLDALRRAGVMPQGAGQPTA